MNLKSKTVINHLKSSSKYTEDRRSSVVDNVKEEINDIHKSNK